MGTPRRIANSCNATFHKRQRLPLLPPLADRLHRESGRIVIDPDAHPTLILTQVVNTVRNGFAQLLVHKIMHLDLFGFAPRSPLAPGVFKRANPLFFLRIHRDHRFAALQKALHQPVDVFKLSIAIRMRIAFLGGVECCGRPCVRGGAKYSASGVGVSRVRVFQCKMSLNGGRVSNTR